MASQGERVPGVVGRDGGVLESMAQDGDAEQEMLVVEKQELPQTDPEPETGAAAAYDTSPPLLRNPPPIPAETAQPSTLDMILQALNGMRNEMKANTRKMEGMENKQDEIKNNMEANTQTMRGEMQHMGLNLRAGQKAIKAVARDETRNMGRCLQAGKMATPRAGTSELGGSATAGRPAVAAGEDRVIRESCWARHVMVTETVSQREKVNGVTETCTARREVTELTGTREIEKIEEPLPGGEGVKDAHTHTGSGG